MEPVITAAESARLDVAADVAVDTLMDRAGLAVALAAIRMGVGYGSRVAVLAGKGNNGGDGYVAARYLRTRGVAVTVHALGSPIEGPAARARQAAVGGRVRVVENLDPVPTDLVIDALFGTGFRGDLPEGIADWGRTGASVLAVDVPSGLNADTGQVSADTLPASSTVTFGARKVGHVVGDGPSYCGELSVVDIGLGEPHPEFRVADAAAAQRPVRDRNAHKWSAGSVLVVGGAPGMSGAPLLAARSALRFGAGAVRLVVPGAVVERVASAAPELMVESSREASFSVADAADIAAARDRFDVLVLGPGLGRASDTFVRALLDQWPGYRVIDADALAAVGGVDRLDGPETVITPHAGEWKRLTGREATYAEASSLRAGLELTVLLKGSPTFVVSDDVAAVTSGGPELATIGSGDVLAGMVAALMARGLGASSAAMSGAFWHGVAGAELANTGTVTADRLAEEIARWAW